MATKSSKVTRSSRMASSGSGASPSGKSVSRTVTFTTLDIKSITLRPLKDRRIIPNPPPPPPPIFEIVLELKPLK